MTSSLGLDKYSALLGISLGMLGLSRRQVSAAVLSCGADFQVSDVAFLPEFGRDSRMSGGGRFCRRPEHAVRIVLAARESQDAAIKSARSGANSLNCRRV